MIGFITTPHWDDLVALGALVVVVALLIYAGCRGIDLAIDAMRRPPSKPTVYADFDHEPVDNTTAIADATRESHSWPNMAPLLVEDAPVDDDPARYATGGPISSRPGLLLVNESGCNFVLPIHGDLPETPAETSQPRHARVEPDNTPTCYMPPVDEPAVVDGPAAMAAVAAVSGQDSAS